MFIGPSGRVLEKLFHASGINRELIFMTNLVKCMLPGNRKPQKSEIELCGQYLDDEISIIQPEVIVPLGQYAARAILHKTTVEFGKLQLLMVRRYIPYLIRHHYCIILHMSRIP